jgi:hypothetical protein
MSKKMNNGYSGDAAEPQANNGYSGDASRKLLYLGLYYSLGWQLTMAEYMRFYRLGDLTEYSSNARSFLTMIRRTQTVQAMHDAGVQGSAPLSQLTTN